MCVLSLNATAQAGKNAVPTKWEKYKIEAQNVSVLFPKLPVVVTDTIKLCEGEVSSQYAAYADDTVFILRITSGTEPPKLCQNKTKFSTRNFEKRLNEVRASKDEKKEEKENRQANRKKYKFIGNDWIQVLINDPEHNRWFELFAASDDLTKKSVNDFLSSIETEKVSEGIEIGEGTERTLGEEVAMAENSAKPGGSGPNEPVRLYLKPRALYTEMARKNGVEGKVQLRVVLAANGGIANVTPISELPYGLTEQAIAAARKIVFRPARRNGVKINVMKIFEYTFTMY
jgi:TonB family protein